MQELPNGRLETFSFVKSRWKFFGGPGSVFVYSLSLHRYTSLNWSPWFFTVMGFSSSSSLLISSILMRSSLLSSRGSHGCPDIFSLSHSATQPQDLFCGRLNVYSLKLEINGWEMRLQLCPKHPHCFPHPYIGSIDVNLINYRRIRD